MQHNRVENRMTSKSFLTWRAGVVVAAAALVAAFFYFSGTEASDSTVRAIGAPASSVSVTTAATAQSSSTSSALPPKGQPVLDFRHMANELGQERDLYAWFHRMLKQVPPSAAQVSLMHKVLLGCRGANEAVDSPVAGEPTELYEELKFRCSGFSPKELDRALQMVKSYAGKVHEAAEDAYAEKRCEDVWRIEQQYGWLPNLSANCLAPGVAGRVPTLFGSQHLVAREFAFYLELSIAEWGAREGMAPSQMHTMQLVLCAQGGYACGTPSQQLALIQYISGVGATFPMSEIDRMRPLIREYLRHPDLSIVGSAPEQPTVWGKRLKPKPKTP